MGNADEVTLTKSCRKGMEYKLTVFDGIFLHIRPVILQMEIDSL